MKLYDVWEVWIYIFIVTIYILARLEFINSDRFLGNGAFVLAFTMDHPVQQQEGYRQLHAALQVQW